MSAVAVIVAAGSGERFGNSAKVLVPLLHRPLLAWTLDAFTTSANITGIVVVVGQHVEAEVNTLVATGQWPKVTAVVQGGSTRQQSMANGVAAVPDDTDIVLVHDAARPLVQSGDIDACIEVAREHGAALLAAPVTDTIKRADHGMIAETLDRSTLWGAQTPQAFRLDWMRAMSALAVSGDVRTTDEASLAEHLGYPVHIVVSDSSNLKITHAHDLVLAEAMLRAREEQP
jgi:2-C-methyl-D-erythritol 4-phosphate cytidylyltransferase